MKPKESEGRTRQTTTRRAALIKNAALLSTFVISQVHTIYSGSETRVNWYAFTDSVYSRRIDFAVMYYGIALDFLILAYCLHFPRGVSKKVTAFILIIAVLDVVHLVLIAKLSFGYSKIVLGLIIWIIIYARKPANRS